MQKKLTITIDEQVYEGLYRVAGARRISQFIESLLRPHVVDQNQSIEEAYKAMAQDQERESEALEWTEAVIGDINNA